MNYIVKNEHTLEKVLFFLPLPKLLDFSSYSGFSSHYKSSNYVLQAFNHF